MESIDSATAKNAFNYVKISIVDASTLKAIVPSALIQEKILTEKGLLRNLRLKFDENLKINFDTDLALFPNYTTIPTKKLLSEEEKYSLLIKKNPHLGTLVQKFNLKLDKK